MMNAQTSHGQILSFVLHATTIAFCASCPVAADSIWNQLFDPADGQFDVSGLPPPSTSVVPGAA